MTVDWITPVYNRTYADVLTAEANPDGGPDQIGAYNAVAINRIENNTQYIAEMLLERHIIRTPLTLTIKTNWVETDIVSRENIYRIIDNIQMCMTNSNPEIFEDFQAIYAATQMSYALANALEYNLYLMKNQPDIPPLSWLLTIENGYIEDEYGNRKQSKYVQEDETVTIVAVPSGDDIEFMEFEHWTGNTDDLQYVGDVNANPTTYTMPYHDYEDYTVTLAASFVTRIPRTLTLTDAFIAYPEELYGHRSGVFYAGKELLLIADTAPVGKRFYEFQGTQEAIDNLTAGEQPSTSWLVMPDCDAELSSFYINAGQHAVYVDNHILGWYDYKTQVTLTAAAPGPKYSLDYWSGDTAYLTDIHTSTFTMPDVTVNFYSHWKYNYSHDNNVQVIGGTIDGQSSISNATEGSQHTIVANSAGSGQGFLAWTLDGAR